MTHQIIVVLWFFFSGVALIPVNYYFHISLVIEIKGAIAMKLLITYIWMHQELAVWMEWDV